MSSSAAPTPATGPGGQPTRTPPAGAPAFPPAPPYFPAPPGPPGPHPAAVYPPRLAPFPGINAGTIPIVPLFDARDHPIWLSQMLGRVLAVPNNPHLMNLKKLVEDPHPLKHIWTTWMQLSESAFTKTAGFSDSRNYGELKLLPRQDVIDTVEQVLEFIHAIGSPNHWPDGSMMYNKGNEMIPVDGLSLFRLGVKPQWEDEKNRDGGHFEMKLTLQNASPEVQRHWIGHVWTATILAVTTAPKTVDPNGIVTGVRLMKKSRQQASFLRLEVWLTESQETQRKSFLQSLKQYIEKSCLNGCDGFSDFPTFSEEEWRSHNNDNKFSDRRKFSRQDSKGRSGGQRR